VSISGLTYGGRVDLTMSQQLIKPCLAATPSYQFQEELDGVQWLKQRIVA